MTGSGARGSEDCGSNATYFASIDTCVPSSILALPSFLSSFQSVKTCSGRTVATSDGVEALRYCRAISGGLTISVSGTADYTALYDIASVSGSLDWREHDMMVWL
jgi:hypothetical protein